MLLRTNLTTFAPMKRHFLLLLLFLPLFSWAQGTLFTLQNLHQTKKGETVESVAELYGITPKELLEANPDIRKNKLKKGTFLNIPQRKEEPTVEIENPVLPEQQAKKDHYDFLRIAVLLPFEDNADRGQKMVEFYRGMLMAADSLKSEGTSVEFYAFHTGTGEAKIRAILEGEGLEGMNAIFASSEPTQLPIIMDFCQQHQVRLVLPFSASGISTEGHPLLYLATPTSNLQQEELADIVCQNWKDKNFIVLNTNQPDERGTKTTELLRARLADAGIAMRNMPLDGDDFAIEAQLNQYHENCIIPDNTSIKTLNMFFSRASSFLKTHSQYKVSLLGYPEWQTYTGSLLKEFYTYDTYFYTTYFRNPLLQRTADIENAFVSNFHTNMQATFPRFGTMGFDLALYFLRGLSQLGDYFEERQNELEYNPFQHPFRFLREGENEGFTNHALMLIHYTPNQTIEIVQ